MDVAEALGLAAGTLTTAAFVPQVLRTWRTRSAEDFSLPMLLMFVAGVALWLGYGIAVAALPVVLANGITLALASVILWVRLRGRRRAAPARSEAR
ncbi:MAG: SemiSWEET transporter [Rhodovarius sp.]|nr:SemiSWEET transporter [Rhodovarius sp.]